MKLTLRIRLRLCWEILAAKSSKTEQQLPIFMRGYRSGYKDAQLPIYPRRDYSHCFYIKDPSEVSDG